MKLLRYIILFMLSFQVSLEVNAQIEDGSIAPDFTVEDINGNVHHLHDYLDQGKTVILEFAATWCFPCWSYLEIGALSDIHKMMGEKGLDNVVVLFIEAEPKNSMDQLLGIQGNSNNSFADNTHGNWIDEISYPIIDNAALGELYEISSYPTIFRICPNEKKVFEIGQGSTNQLLNKILKEECNPPKHEHDLAILRYTGTETICAAEETRLQLEIINLGRQGLSNPTISISDGTSELASSEWSGYLSSYQRKKVFLEPMKLDDNTTLHFTIHNDLDQQPQNNSIDQFLSYAVESAGYEVEVEIFTDQYGFETYWELRSDDGTIYAKGGNEEVGRNGGGPPYINQPYGEGAYFDLEFIERKVALPEDGCYEFFIADDFGDGICCSHGDGYFRITDNHGITLIEGGKFADSATYPFSKIQGNATPVQDIDAEQKFSLFPNPSNGQLNIQIDELMADDYQLDIYNAIGNKVLSQNKTIHPNELLSLNLSHLSKGIYFLSLKDDKGQQYSQRFTLF